MGLLWGTCGRGREKRGEETLAWFRWSWNPLKLSLRLLIILVICSLGTLFFSFLFPLSLFLTNYPYLQFNPSLPSLVIPSCLRYFSQFLVPVTVVLLLSFLTIPFPHFLLWFFYSFPPRKFVPDLYKFIWLRPSWNFIYRVFSLQFWLYGFLYIYLR